MRKNKIDYYFRIILRMDYKRLFKTVSIVHKRSGKNRIILLIDIIKCGLRHGAGYRDYELYEFENLTEAQRSDYVTRARNNQIISQLNDKNYMHFFNDKAEFNKLFKKFIKRDCLDLKKCTPLQFKNFLQNKNFIIVKPADGSCGKGIEKIEINKKLNFDELYKRLIREEKTIAEDYIIQCGDISRLYPHSVNTVRIGTIRKGNNVEILYAYIRMGNNGSIVDNNNAGGMCAPIDIETGIITHPAYDKTCTSYVNHPYTGVKIVGFQIPMWEQVKAMCLEAAEYIPQIRYTGWDVCITENGPLLVEGNEYPGYDFLQLPPHNPNKEGYMHIFKKYFY